MDEKNMSGKSDFILINENRGLTRLIRKALEKKELQILSQEQINMLNPIIWDGNSQISGDEIILKFLIVVYMCKYFQMISGNKTP